MKFLFLTTCLLLSFSTYSMDQNQPNKRQAQTQGQTEPNKRICIKSKPSEQTSDECSSVADDSLDDQVWRDKKYEELSANSFIKMISGKMKKAIPDVGMDKYYLATDNEDAIATSGVNTCFAIGAVAWNASDEPILAMAHLSSAATRGLRLTFEGFVKDLTKRECKEGSIKFYVIGGGLDTIDAENDFLDLSADFNIVAVIFNPLNLDFNDITDETINVVLRPDGLYYGKGLRFDAVPGKEDCGWALQDAWGNSAPGLDL